MFDRSQQDMMFSTTLRQTNCSSIDCLRALPTDAFATLSQQVLNASDSIPGAGYGTWLWGPVIDGKFVKKHPSVAFEEGEFYDMPIMVDHERYVTRSFEQIEKFGSEADVLQVRRIHLQQYVSNNPG
jgi:carboxylesterase type B